MIFVSVYVSVIYRGNHIYLGFYYHRAFLSSLIQRGLVVRLLDLFITNKLPF